MPKPGVELVKRGLIAAAWLLVAAGAVGAWITGVPRLEAYAAERMPAPSIRVRLVDPPRWMGDVQPWLEQLVAAEIGGGPLDWEGLDAGREAIERSGWFLSVDRVERISADIVEVRGRYVEPFAVVHDGDGHHLVDESARLLPMRYPHTAPPRFTERDGKVVPWFMILEGPRFPRPTGVGATWDGADIAAGLRLAHYLAAEPWNDQIAAIDIGEYTTAESLWIVTTRGARIRWGRAPGDESAVEVPARQKRDYLQFMYEGSGLIDRGMKELDITGDRVYAR
jgi:hypothetical protein